MSGFVVVVRVVVVVTEVVVVVVTDVVVVVEEKTGKRVSVKLTSVTVVSNVVETDAGKSFSIVVINSISLSLSFGVDFTAVITKYAVVDIAPATTKNIKMNFMRAATFLVSPEPF